MLGLILLNMKISQKRNKVSWVSGSDEPVILIEADGTYSETISLTSGGNYIGIECDNFTGSIEIDIE